MIGGFWPNTAIYIPWTIWVITWVTAAIWTGRTVKRPGVAREWLYRVFALAGFVLLLGGAIRHTADGWAFTNWPGLLGTHLFFPPLAVGWALVGGAFLGFAFAWWARLHLGLLWSGSITRKEGHRVVDTGPYAIVRHPIYTGILGAAVASAIVMGNLHAWLGAALLILAYWMKARLEEHFLREELGAEAYESYRRRVPMLVPFAPA
jgi:protein-S-isoprenylcysteine O-methyltransferase Ste14